MFILHGDLQRKPFVSVHEKEVPYNVPSLLTFASKLQDNKVPLSYGYDDIVFVFHPTSRHVYFFPGCEPNDFKRVEDGIKFFVAQGFESYKCNLRNAYDEFDV